MNTEPVAFLREDLPELFNRGVAGLKEKADGGDERASARYADVSGARGVVRVLLEGEGGGDVYLSVDGGTMKVLDGPTAGLPSRVAFAVSASAIAAGLEELDDSGAWESEKAPKSVTRLASARIEQILEGQPPLEFHVVLKDVPDLDQVKIRIGLGSAEPPDEPTFAAAVSWDDIEDVRAGELTPQQLFGRLRITGDASRAMAIGMMLMQRPR